MPITHHGICRFCKHPYSGTGTIFCSAQCRVDHDRANNSHALIRLLVSELTDDMTKHWSEYPCLEWSGYCNQHGYGEIAARVNGTRRVHRLSYELFHGVLPKELSACHHCDNPPCFRPIHLFAGTTIDNMRDAASKNRLRPCRGEASVRAKLTDEQVRHIRELGAEGSLSDAKLAAMFGVGHTTISDVILRHRWRHID